GQAIGLSIVELWSRGPRDHLEHRRRERCEEGGCSAGVLNGSALVVGSRLRGAANALAAQTAEMRNRDDRALRRCRDGSRHGRIHFQRQGGYEILSSTLRSHVFSGTRFWARCIAASCWQQSHVLEDQFSMAA